MLQTATSLSNLYTPRSDAGVRASLSFITPQATKPVFYSPAYTGGDARVLFETERHPVDIADLRLLAASLSIDREGFALLSHGTEVEDLYDDQALVGPYYREIETLLKSATGASRVVIFDATRRSDSAAGASNPDGARRPAIPVHVGYTVTSGPRRFRDLVGPAEAARLTAAGARIIQLNVWRPIRGPVERSPLAVADAPSIRSIRAASFETRFPEAYISGCGHGRNLRRRRPIAGVADEGLA